MQRRVGPAEGLVRVPLQPQDPREIAEAGYPEVLPTGEGMRAALPGIIPCLVEGQDPLHVCSRRDQLPAPEVACPTDKVGHQERLTALVAFGDGQQLAADLTGCP